MKLLLIRHAAAVPRGTPGVPDGERQLTADGEAEFRSAAGGLAWIVDPPDVLLSSPLARARATAGIAARTFGRLEPRIEPALAHGTLETILAALASHGSTATMALVGHEPLLSALLARLLAVSDSDRLGFEKGGAALVDLPDGLASAGRLVWFLDPRILRTLAGRRESATEERIRARVFREEERSWTSCAITPRASGRDGDTTNHPRSFDAAAGRRGSRIDGRAIPARAGRAGCRLPRACAGARGTRLGDGAPGTLSRDAIDETLRAVRRFVSRHASDGRAPRIVAVATAAVRDATGSWRVSGARPTTRGPGDRRESSRG